MLDLPRRSQDEGSYLDLIHNVESIVVPAIREDDAIQRDRHPVSRSSRAARPSILEVRFRALDGGCSTEDHKASDDDEEQGADFDDADAVGEPVCVFGVEDQSLGIFSMGSSID
jgi:hypothetical protein